MSLQDYLTSLSNSTNVTLSRHPRHENFVTDIKNPTCEMVAVMPYDQRCKYVISQDECHEDILLIDYTILYYCKISPETGIAVALSICLLVLFCLILFLLLGTASDSFFCPCLKVLAKIMGLSENLAGVTLLAFGNAAPDMFTSIAGVQAQAREAYNDVMGGVCFVNLFVTSVIMLMRPFRLLPSSFLRDSLFLILDIAFLDYAIKSGNTVTLTEAILMVALYIVYIIVIVVDQYLLLRATKRLRKKSMAFGLSAVGSRLKDMESEAHIDILSRSAHTHVDIAGAVLRDKKMGNSNEGLFRQFFDSLMVLDMDDWRTANMWFRVFLVVRFPIMLLLTILLPVVDYELNLNGWTKLLNTLQVAFLPPLVVFGFTRELKTGVLGMPLAVVFFAGTIPLAITIFITTRTDSPPFFHSYLSILGVMGSVFVVYCGASELIQILKVLGYITHRSNSFLGCTLLAWGNSVGDLIANTAMATHGYQRMGFAACYGGPLFNTLMTVGVIFIYRTASSSDFEIQTGEGTLGENSTIFVLIGSTTFLLGILTTNFEIRRVLAAFPLLIYILYLTFCILSEFELMHPYGSDHRMDQRAEPADF